MRSTRSSARSARLLDNERAGARESEIESERGQQKKKANALFATPRHQVGGVGVGVASSSSKKKKKKKKAEPFLVRDDGASPDIEGVECYYTTRSEPKRQKRTAGKQINQVRVTGQEEGRWGGKGQNKRA